MAAPKSDRRMNAEWHAQHRMPVNPTLEARLEWHTEHARICGCRPMPVSVAAALSERGRKHNRE